MTALALGADPPPFRADELGRWSAALVFVLAAHVIFGLVALSRREAAAPASEAPAAILIELSASSPSDSAPSELPPAPNQIAAPDAPIAPTEDEPEAFSEDDLAPVAEAVAGPTQDVIGRPLTERLDMTGVNPLAAATTVHEATTEPFAELLTADDLKVSAVVSADQTREAVVAFPDALALDALDPAAETALDAAPQATAEPLLDQLDMSNLAPSTEATSEPVDHATLQPRVEIVISAPPPRPRPDAAPETRTAEALPPPLRNATTRAPAPTTPRKGKRRATAPHPPAPQTSAPAAQPQQSAAASAPQSGAAAASPSVSPDRWQSSVYRHLERRKRYPRAAESRRIGGTVRVRFVIRHGNILSHRITASSGHAELDAAVSSLIDRASPIPAPPPEVFKSGMSIEVPIRFSAR